MGTIGVDTSETNEGLVVMLFGKIETMHHLIVSDTLSQSGGSENYGNVGFRGNTSSAIRTRSID